MQRQILERFDLRRFPAALLRPVDGQHVVGELFAEEQRGGVGLRLAFCVAFDGEICCLRWRRQASRRRVEKKRRKETDKSRAGDENSDCFFKLLLLT